jgi:hypothetical protein
MRRIFALIFSRSSTFLAVDRRVRSLRSFLRRLRHKIYIGDPSYGEYREIFRRVAQAKGVAYSDQGLAYLLQEWYIKRGRKLRASHPRDICDQIIDIARYRGIEPTMTRELIDQAAAAYFVDL